MKNEITVKLKCSLNEIYHALETKEFEIVDKFSLDDRYYIKKDVDIYNTSPRKVLQNYVLVRDITQYMPNESKVIKMTYKTKNIAKDGTIIEQKNVNCEITSINEGETFLKELGYKEIMRIKESDIVYGKDDFEIAVKDIEGGDNLIEIETNENNTELDTTEKLIKKLNEFVFTSFIDTNDYFVKKAEDKLKEIVKYKGGSMNE